MIKKLLRQLTFSLLFPVFVLSQPTFQVTKVSPESNATSAFVNSAVTATFSKQVATGTLGPSNFVVYSQKSGLVTGTIQYETSTRTATFLPGSPFPGGDKITVVLNKSIQSVNGEPLENGYIWNFEVQVPQGDVKFLQEQQFIDMQLSAVASADFNHDGTVDVAVAGEKNGLYYIRILYYRNGTFVSGESIRTPFKVRPMYVGDFDRDGYTDLLLVYRYAGCFSVCFIDQFNSPSLGPVYYCSRPGSETRAAVVTDLDGNGSLDAALINRVPKNGIALEFATTFLPEAYTGQDYSAELEARNGTPPYSMDIVAGGLPSGLSFDPQTFEISGTPQGEGLFVFSVRLSDAKNNYIIQDFTIDVTVPPLVNEEFTGSELTGFETYIPVEGPALNLDDKNGFLHVSIPGTRKYDHWRHVDDAPQLFRIVGGDDWEATTRCELQSVDHESFHLGMSVYLSQYDLYYWGFFGSKNSILLNRSGSSTIVEVAYDEGKTVDLRVRKTDGQCSFEYKAPDDSEWILAKQVTLPALPLKVGLIAKTWNYVNLSAFYDFFRLTSGEVKITSEDLPAGQVGRPYSFALQAKDGLAPYQWYVYKGYLPDGLLLDPSTGQITGIPRKPGHYTFRIEVKDNAIPQGSMNKLFKLTVDPVEDKALLVYLNDGSGRLGVNEKSVSWFWETNKGESIFARDFNNDGWIDIGATKSGVSGGVFLFMNPGNGWNFSDTPHRNYNLEIDYENIFSADLNRNGLPDILGADLGSDKVYFYRHTGVTNNIPDYSPPVPYSSSYQPVALDYTDINADGNHDLVVLGADDNALSILVNSGSADFLEKETIPVTNSAKDFTIGDFNNDSAPDIYVVDSTGTTTLLLNDIQMNTPPDAPQLSLPADNGFVKQRNPAFIWQNPVDADNDPLHFVVNFSKSTNGNVINQTTQFDSRQNPGLFSPTPPVSQAVSQVTLAPGSLEEGGYSWSVTAWDALAASQPSQTHNFTVDGTPPSALTLVFINPEYNDHWFTADADPVLVRFSYTESNADSAILDVEGQTGPLVNPAIPSGTARSVNFSINRQVADGRYNVEGTLVDKAGNKSTVTTFFEIDSTPPTGTTASTGSDTSNSTSFQVLWNGGSDAGSGLSGAYQVRVKVDDNPWTVWLEKVSTKTGVYQGRDGHTYAFEAAAYDNLDNLERFTGTAEATIVVDLSAGDTTPPGPPENLTANGSNPGAWQKSAGFSLEWDNPFDVSGIANSFWKIGSEPTSNSNFNGSGGPAGPVDITLELEGSVPVYLWLSDNSGNVNYLNYAGVVCRWDQTVPEIENLYLIEPVPVYNSQGVFWYTAEQDSFILRVRYAEMFPDYMSVDTDGLNGVLENRDLPGGPGDQSIRFDIPLIDQDGRYDLSVVLADSAGNTAEAQTTVGLDGTPPANCTAGADTLSKTLDFTVSWSPGDDGSGSGISNYDVFVKIDDGEWTKWLDASTATQNTYAGSQGYRYTFEAIARDNVGNVEPFTGTGEVSVSVDTATADVNPPPAPVNLSAGGARDQSPWQSNPVFEIDWQNPDDESGISACYYKLGDPPVSNSDTTASGPAIGPVSVHIGEGETRMLYLWLVDGMGNTDYRRYAQVLLRYDAVLPVIDQLAFNSPAPGYVDTMDVNWYNQTSVTRCTLTVNYSENNTDSVFAANPASGQMWPAGSPAAGEDVGSDIYFDIGTMDDGIYPLDVYVVDLAGNRSYAPLTLALDSTPPQNAVASGPDTSSTEQFVVTWSAGKDDGSGLAGLYKIWVQELGGDWSVWLEETGSLSATFSGLHGRSYGFQATTRDHLGNTEPLDVQPETVVIVDTTAAKDITPPAAPVNLLADGSSPSPWNAGPDFSITWEKPQDISGILKSLYKLGGPPAHNADTTGTGPASGPLRVNASKEFGETLYLWLMDAQNNVDYTNHAQVVLRWDNTAPQLDSLVLQEPIYGENWYNPFVRREAFFQVHYTEMYPADMAVQTIPEITVEEQPGAPLGQGLFRLMFPDSIDVIADLVTTLTDSAGNRTADTTQIALDSTPPVGTVAASPDTVEPGTFTVSWQGAQNDGAGSGISGLYDVKVKIDGGDWIVWKSRFRGTEDGYNGELGHVYAFEAAAYDNVGRREKFTGDAETQTVVVEDFIDTTAPEAPRTLTVNGGPSGTWSNNSTFAISWQNPADPSGIAKCYYKFETPPASADDYDGSDEGTPPISITVDAEGCRRLYLWLQDGKDNTDYQNYGRIKLCYDGTSPVIDSSFVQNAQFDRRWINPDSAQKAHVRFYYSENRPDSLIVLTGPVQGDLVYTTPPAGMGQSVDIELNVAHLRDGCYDVVTVLTDSASNAADDSLKICLDSAPPVGSRAASPSISLSEDFVVSWAGPGLGDDGEGAGLSGFYDLYYSKDDGEWQGLFSRERKTSHTFRGEHDHSYAFEVLAWDHVGNREPALEVAETTTRVDTLSVDNEPPGAPIQLLSNGSSPSPWQNGPVFTAVWQNPADPSGVAKALYKLGEPPVSNSDTTATVGVTNGSAELTLAATQEYGQMLYIWLMDGQGNADYNNNSSILLRYDVHAPVVQNIKPVQPAFLDNWYNQESTGEIYIRTFYDEKCPDYITLSYLPVLQSKYIIKTSSEQDSADQKIDISAFNDGAYWIKAVVTDSAGNQSAPDSVRIQLDSRAPKISYVQNDTLVPENTPYQVSAQIYDENFIDTVQLQYWQGGQRARTYVDMMRVDDSTFTATIPADEVTDRGLEYAIWASDGLSMVREPGLGPDQSSFGMRVKINGGNNQGLAHTLTNDPGIKSDAYRMISLPIQVDKSLPADVLEDDLGEYNKQKWRFYEWNAPDSLFAEYPNVSPLRPGYAFWLITSMKDVTITSGPGTSVNTVEPFVMLLQQGWTDIGNPFHFDVDWHDIFTASAADTQQVFGPYAFEGRWLLPFEVERMQPWKGYSFYTEKNDISLVIPALESRQAMKKPAGQKFFNRTLWTVAVDLQFKEQTGARIYFGCSENTGDGYDYGYDFVAPPSFGTKGDIYFLHPDWQGKARRYATDIRSIKAGDIWEFEVTSNVPNIKAGLDFNPLQQQAGDMELTLIDLDAGMSVDLLEEQSYSFWMTNNKRRFKVLAGSGEFMQQHQDDLPDQISGYQLVQNYPNPFNNTTVITMKLEEDTHVRLAIYNLLAQHVRTLYDGRAKRGLHQFHWNAADNNGRELGAGIYILRLETPGYSATRKMIYMR